MSGGAMSEDPRSDLAKEIDATMRALESFEVAGTDIKSLATERGDALPVLAHGVRIALAAAATALGECRLDVPYAPMQPINDNQGFRWCCTHSPPHCSPLS
jgi:hypothetical protein